MKFLLKTPTKITMSYNNREHVEFQYDETEHFKGTHCLDDGMIDQHVTQEKVRICILNNREYHGKFQKFLKQHSNSFSVEGDGLVDLNEAQGLLINRCMVNLLVRLNSSWHTV